MQETPDSDLSSKAYESPPLEQDSTTYVQDPPVRCEPLPSLFFIIVGFMFCLFCHGITALGLLSYIDKVGGPTSKILDSTFFGYAPIIASLVGCVFSIASVTVSRNAGRRPE